MIVCNLTRLSIGSQSSIVEYSLFVACQPLLASTSQSTASTAIAAAAAAEGPLNDAGNGYKS